MRANTAALAACLTSTSSQLVLRNPQLVFARDEHNARVVGGARTNSLHLALSHPQEDIMNNEFTAVLTQDQSRLVER